MRNLMFVLVALMLVTLGCAKFEEEVIPEVVDTSGYTLKLNATVAKDSVHYLVNELALVEVADKTGKSVVAEFNFGDGTSTVVADKATNKYVKEGVYKLTATVVNVTPVVKLSVNVVIGKTAVINPVSGEKTVIALDSSFVNGVNTITYGLKLDIYGLDNSAIYVEASVPGKPWSTYTNATETIVKNGFKYVKWQVVCGNGDIRVGWYQYHTKDGLKVKEWSNTSDSKYYKDGLPEFSVYNGTTYKLGTAPVTTKVFTLKLEGTSFVNDTNRVSLNTIFSAKVFDELNVETAVDFDFSNGTKAVNVTGASNSYAITGTYKVTATVKSVTPNKVLTAYVVVPKVVVPVYVLKVNNEVVANGGTVKLVEGASAVFKVYDSANKLIMSKFTATGASSVIADSKTVIYLAAGTYVMSIETQNDATLLSAKIEVTKVTAPVYTLKINNETVVNGATVKTTEGTSLAFKVIDAAGIATVAKLTFGDGIVVNSDGRSYSYAKAGTYQFQAEAGTQTIKVAIEVAKVNTPTYTLKINNETVVNGATVKTTEGIALAFKVIDAAGVATVAKLTFGDGTVVNSDGRSYSYAKAGTYQFQAEAGTQTIKVAIEVAKVNIPTYTLKVNNQTVAEGATIETLEGSSVSFKTVNAAGATVIANYNFGDNTSETTDNTAKVYNVAGTYKVVISINSVAVANVNIKVNALPKTDTYVFLINGWIIGGTASLVEGASTSIKVANVDGTVITAYIDLGNGTKLTTNNATVTYVAGTYTISAVIGNITITKKIEVTKSVIVDPVKPESIVLISSSVSGSTINAIFGLRCNAINNFSSARTTYVAGETPGVNWKDYQLSEIVTINDVNYFKWSVSVPAGKFRMSWVQMRDGGTELYKGNWANDLNSLYWNVGEGLFLFNLSIDGSSAKLTK